MTVRDWLSGVHPEPPAALRRQIVTALGNDADADASQTTAVCLDAAVRSLESLLADERFDRASALDLLAIDALTTYAFEYAGSSGSPNIEATAARAARTLGHLL